MQCIHTLDDIASEYCCTLDEIIRMSQAEFTDILIELQIPVIHRRKLALQKRNGQKKTTAIHSYPKIASIEQKYTSQNTYQKYPLNMCYRDAPQMYNVASGRIATQEPLSNSCGSFGTFSHEQRKISRHAQIQPSSTCGAAVANVAPAPVRNYIQWTDKEDKTLRDVICSFKEMDPQFVFNSSNATKVSETFNKSSSLGNYRSASSCKHRWNTIRCKKKKVKKTSKTIEGFILPDLSKVNCEDQCIKLFNSVSKHNENFVSNLMYVTMLLMKLPSQSKLAKLTNITQTKVSSLIRGVACKQMSVQVAGGRFILWCSKLRLCKNVKTNKIGFGNLWKHEEKCALVIAISRSMVLGSNILKLYPEFKNILPNTTRTVGAVKKQWLAITKLSKPEEIEISTDSDDTDSDDSGSVNPVKPSTAKDCHLRMWHRESALAATALLDCGMADVAKEIDVPLHDLENHLNIKFSSAIGSKLESWLKNFSISLNEYDSTYLERKPADFTYYEDRVLLLCIVRHPLMSWSTILSLFRHLTNSKRGSPRVLERRWLKLKKENFSSIKAGAKFMCGYCENEIDQGSEIFEKCKNRVELFNKKYPNNRYCSTKFCSIYCVENARPDLPWFDFECETNKCNFTGTKEEVEEHEKLCGTKNDIKKLIDETCESQKSMYPIIKCSLTSFAFWSRGKTRQNDRAVRLIGIRLRKWYAKIIQNENKEALVKKCTDDSNKIQNESNSSLRKCFSKIMQKSQNGRSCDSDSCRTWYSKTSEKQTEILQKISEKQEDVVVTKDLNVEMSISPISPICLSDLNGNDENDKTTISKPSARFGQNQAYFNENMTAVPSIVSSSGNVVNCIETIVCKPSASECQKEVHLAQNSVVVTSVECTPVKVSNYVEEYNTIEPSQNKKRKINVCIRGLQEQNQEHSVAMNVAIKKTKITAKQDSALQCCNQENHSTDFYNENLHLKDVSNNDEIEFNV